MQSEENEAAPSVVDSEDNMDTLIDREIDKEIAEIRNGTHPNLVLGAKALEEAKQKKIDASDRHRKMQIKNINALYEYEVEDATALFNVSVVHNPT